MFDDKYFDGHGGTPILPPGAWDYDPSMSDLANWRNFDTNLGHFDPLMDSAGHQYGWKFVGNQANADYQGPAAYFEGSPGVDYVDLGPMGAIHSLGLGEGELGTARTCSSSTRATPSTTGPARARRPTPTTTTW